MTTRVTLEQVEQIVAQLPFYEQLKLVAHISERLSKLMPQETDEECQRREYIAQVEAFLTLSDELAAEAVGEVDSAEDIRNI